MKLQLADHWRGFVEKAVQEGRFGSIDDVVTEGLHLVEERESKLVALRDMIQSSIAQGGEITDDDLDVSIAAKADELRRQGFAD